MTETTTNDPRQELSERLFGALISSLEMLSIHVGQATGMYDALVDGPATYDDVAKRADVHPRYAQEWLEQQASAGFLTVDDASAAPADRRFALPDVSREVLLDTASPYHVGSLAGAVAGIGRIMPQLVEVFRTGDGISFGAFGPELREGLAGGNRPMFVNDLGSGWLPALPDVHERLQAEGARVLDLGCGAGASTIAIATAYPRAEVVGIDLDEGQIAAAQGAAASAGVGERLSFSRDDAASRSEDRPFDLVTIFEALHDMGDPVGALRAARSAVAPGGVVLVADEKVAEEFQAPGDEVERLNYGFSVLHCLPATMAEQPVEASGTVLRPGTVRRWAEDAGFSAVDVVDIDNDLWRFYRLTP